MPTTWRMSSSSISTSNNYIELRKHRKTVHFYAQKINKRINTTINNERKRKKERKKERKNERKKERKKEKKLHTL